MKLVTLPALALTAATALPASAQSTDRDWRHVQKLEPGREIALTLDDAPPAPRLFVSGSDSQLTFLNLSDPALPPKVARALAGVIPVHAASFERVLKGETLRVDGVQLTRDGVFLADRKVADLQSVVQTAPRSGVTEVSMKEKGRGFWGHLGPIGGYFVGGLAGGYASGLACKAFRQSSGQAGRQASDCGGAFLVGMVVGGVGGAGYGTYAARHETERVIYRRASPSP